MRKRKITAPEFNAVLAGLRLLQQGLDGEALDVLSVEQITTNGGAQHPVTAKQIDTLCDDLNFDRITLEDDMAISIGYRNNFETLLKAARAGNKNLALVECTDRASGRPVMTVCALNWEKSGACTFVPLAKLFDGNPYDELDPPAVPD